MSETQASVDAQLSNNPANVRHFMWNDDYIELLSLRLELSQVKHLVEIGSGLGYLAGLFGLYMKPGSTVRGFDADPAVVAAGAGKTSAEVEAFFAAKPYLQTANRLRPAGATPYRIRKAADLADFIAEEYAPLVRGQVYAGGEPLTNTEIRGLSEAVVTDLGLPETHVTALYAAGGAIALAMAPAAADPATKETFFAIVRGWDR